MLNQFFKSQMAYDSNSWLIEQSDPVCRNELKLNYATRVTEDYWVYMNYEPLNHQRGGYDTGNTWLEPLILK